MAAAVGSFHVNCGALQFSVLVQLKGSVLNNVATEVDNFHWNCPSLQILRRNRSLSLRVVLSFTSDLSVKPPSFSRPVFHLDLSMKLPSFSPCAEKESWTSFATVVSQRRSYGHCLCDSVLHNSWDSSCVVRWSLRNAGRTLP